MKKSKGSDEWNLVSNETFATGRDSWEENGELYVRQKVLTGSPNEVKKALGDLKNGARTKMPYAHNIKVYEKVMHNPTVNGTVKEKVFKVCEGDNLGDGDEPMPSNLSNASSVSQDAPASDPTGPSALQVLKNFTDQIAADTRLQWICIACLAALGVAAFVLALTY